jgi:anti-sigma B factor antagonist
VEAERSISRPWGSRRPSTAIDVAELYRNAQLARETARELRALARIAMDSVGETATDASDTPRATRPLARRKPQTETGVDGPACFDVAVSLGADRARFHLRGELDMAAADRLTERFNDALHADGTTRSVVVMDLLELTYCDSSGIRTLLKAAARCQRDGTRFRTVGAGASVRRVLEITDTVEALNLTGEASDEELA